MIHFNDRNKGFTFIEIVLTISLVGMVVSPLLITQYSVLRVILNATDRIGRIFSLEMLLSNILFKKADASIKDLAEKKSNEDPAMEMSLDVIRPSKGSPLSSVEGIAIMRAQGTWSLFGRPMNETVISFIYKPEQKESST